MVGQALGATTWMTMEEDDVWDPSVGTSADQSYRRSLTRRAVLGSKRSPTIGRFELVRRIGSGAMGAVYLAQDPTLSRPVAIKILRSGDHRILLKEAQALARLAHPNIVSVHEVGEQGPELFIVMEYVAGRSLNRWLAEARRTTRDILAVFVQAGRGLEAAHAEGYVHRDFKPENVMISASGIVKVLDFGLAHAVAEDDRSGTKLRPISSTTTPGTPGYMAPEQIDGAPPDARSDQYSFCVALFEALYGVRPFPGDTIPEVIAALTTGTPSIPPGARRVRRKIRAALIRGLSRSPQDRWPSLAMLLENISPERPRRVAPLRIGRAVRVVIIALGLATLGALVWAATR